MKSIKAIIFSIIVSTLAMTAYFVVTGKSAEVITTINAERIMIAKVMGITITEEVIENTDNSFQKLDSLYGYTYELLPDRETEFEQVKSDGTKGFFKRYNLSLNESHDTFWAMIYQSIQRMWILGELSGLALVLILAAGIDGWTTRKINAESFRYASPIFYQFGFFALFGGITLIVSITTLPFELPFWAFTLSAFALALFVRQIFANMPAKM